MRRRILCIMAMSLVLSSGLAMAQSGSWSDKNYQSQSWGNDYDSRNSYDINNESDLAKFAYMVGQGYDFKNKTITLKAHLNLYRNEWTPIGTTEHPFRGSFNGDGYSISGVHPPKEGCDYAGLFGYVSGGSVEDVLMVNSAFTSNEHVGSIAGAAENATIADCRIESSVRLQGEARVGHVAGLLKNGAKVLGCSSLAKIEGETEGYGIVGSKDETCVVQHSLYVDAGRPIVGTQPAFYIDNHILGATLNYGTPIANYTVSKIIAYENGFSYTGNRLAVKGETVTFSVEGNTITSRSMIMANGQVLTASDGQYSLTMGEEDVNITQEEATVEWTSGTTVCRLEGTTLTVSPTAGGGEMSDYGGVNDAPWHEYRDEIQTLIFEEGVTRIGETAFAQSHQINDITIPLSMTSIGKNAFLDANANDVYCYPTAGKLQVGENRFGNKPRWHVFSDQLEGYKGKSDKLPADFVGDLSSLTLNANGDNSAWLEAADGSVCDVTLQGLKLVREGFTLCVPFTINNIYVTPLAGAEIHEIANIQVMDREMRLRIGPAVSKIEAGKLYYGLWNTPGGDLQSPVFRDVTVSAAAPEQKVYPACTLQGLYSASTIEDMYTTEVHGPSFSETKGREHAAFQACILSQEMFERFNFVSGDYIIHVTQTGKPEWWPDVEVWNGNKCLALDDVVSRGSILTFFATVGVGYDLEWYVDGVKQNNTTSSLSLIVGKNTQVEARYIEHKKLTFRGSPLVRYADSKGVVSITQNYYNYDYIKQKAFANTVQSWTGSNGKTYLVDNLLQDNKVTTETLTEDVEMVPVTALNEEDMGDNTVTVTWRFDLPDSMALFRNQHGADARFPYVMPTEFASYYIDVAMTIDATKGLITNDLRKAEGNTFVGKGTKMTVPAKYGATYKLLTTKRLSNVRIAGSKDFIYSKVGNNCLATMHYYRTDLDSVVVEIGEDMELIYLEASYPGGDNELMIRPTVNKAESTITTQSKVGESGCLLYNLSDVENRGNLKVTPSVHATGTSLIEMPAQFDEDRYMCVTFEVKEGYSFKPKTTNLYTMPVNTGTKANVRLMLIDERGNKADTIFQNVPQNVMKLDTLKPKAPSKAEELCLYGKVELRIYVYGTSGNYRLGDSITIGGELCQSIQFPEGQTYVPRLITSPIDFDGIGLLNIQALEVVNANEDTQLVTMTALEECPMGNVMLLKSDTPGALYNIPLTRPDDSYIAGQGILQVSDGTVIGTKHHYVFGMRNGVYGFFMAAIGDPIAEGDVYFYHNGLKDLLAYYLNPSDVPPTVDDVILFADGDNNGTIQSYHGRVVNSVTLGGRTFYKDGRMNLVTLPFNILGRDIKKSPLKNATIFEFDPEYTSFDAATGQLNLAFENAYEIEAGKPYLVSWNKGEDIPNPTFENVTFFDNSLVEETSSDGHVTFHPSYASLDLRNSDKMLMTIRNSMGADSCIHAMKAYFTLEATSVGVTDVEVDISMDNPSEYMEVDDEYASYSVLYNKIVDFEDVTLARYTGEGGIVEVADSITVNIDGDEVPLAVRSVDANAFSSVGHEITALDMTRCLGLKPLTIDRTTPDTPFFGLNEGAIVYLPAGKAQPADNVVSGGICNKLILDDRYGFAPLYDFTAQQVVLNRTTTAANGWQALCLPFEMTAQMAEKWSGELLEFAGAKKENGTLTLFCNESEAAPAGKPAIIRWTNGAPDEMTFSDIDITTAKADSADYNGVALYGSYMPVTLSESDQAKLFVADSRAESYILPGFQAYFVMDNEVTDDFSSVCVNYTDGTDYDAIEPLTGYFDVAYAFWCEDTKTLHFTVPESRVNVGDSYDGQAVTMLWKGADVLMTGADSPGWKQVNSQVEHVVFHESFGRVRPTSCYGWFRNFRNLTDIDGLHNLRTSEVTTMVSMFASCSSLKEIILGFFDTSNVTDMRYMFSGCTALEWLNPYGWQTSQVTNMEYMFSNCANLQELNIDSFDTRSVTNMRYMFFQCRNLADIDVSNFNTTQVTNMNGMFKNCQSLKDLNLTSFDTGNVTNVRMMFENDYALTTITVGEGWTMDKVETSAYMFNHASSLVGQNGTRYDYNTNSASYAHVDGGIDNPGLLWGIADVSLTDLADNSETLNRYGGHMVNVAYDRQFAANDNGDGTWTSCAFTVCLPYTKDLWEQFDAGQIRLYQLAAVNEDLEFVFIGDAPVINAGTPCLLVVENGSLNLNADNVKMLAHPNEHVEESIVSSSLETWGEPDDLVGWWRGTFRVIDNDESTQMHAFGLSTKDGKWKPFNNDTESHRASYIPQFRSYFVPLEYKGPYAYETKFKYLPAGEDVVNPDWEKLPDEYVGDINEDGTGINPVIHTIDGDGTHQYYDLSGRKLPGKPQKGIYIDNGVKRIKK